MPVNRGSNNMATFSMKQGWAYRLQPDREWATQAVPPSEVGNTAIHTPVLTVGGVACVAFSGRDGSIYAQPLGTAIDPETVGVGTEPQPPGKRRR